jgi:hypothetical protein
MATYRVQQAAVTYYEIIVEADNQDEALELGMTELMNDEGYEVDGSFEWQDDTWIEEVEQ